MPLTEDTVVDLIQVLMDGQIQVRQSNRVFRDGIQISTTYHRYVLDPGTTTIDDPLIQLDPRLINIIIVLWTKDVVDARKQFLADQEKARLDKINASTGGLNG